MEVGSRVLVVGGKTGIVRFMGTTDFAQGDWVGIELDTPDGKNDGEINGVRYFTCEPSFGLFAKKSQVRLARMSLGYGASNPLSVPPAAPSAATSRLQQMREKRVSSSNLTAPSSSSSIAKKTTTPKMDTKSSPAASLPRKSPTATKPPRTASPLSPTSVTSPKADSVAVAAPSDGPDPLCLELTHAKEKIELLMDELEVKNTRIADLETEVAEAASSAAQAALDAQAAADAMAVAAAPSKDDDVVSPRAAYDAKLRELRDEGIAVAAKMRKDFEIKTTKLEKAWEDKEARFVAETERLDALRSALETECVALRARNTQLAAAEHTRAEELASWQAKVGAATRKAESHLALVAELQDAVEMLTLEKETLAMDKEIAEERIDECEAALEASKLNQSLAWSGESSSGSGSVEDENAKLRVAVKAMHDRHACDKADAAKQIKDLTKQVAELSRYRDDVETMTTKLARAEASVEELKEMLDLASAYESMVETLTDTNLSLGDQVADLTAAVASLESLKDMSDEMEHQADLLAKELQDELATTKQKVLDLTAAAAVAATHLQDKDRTIQRFRDLVARNRDEVAALREKLRLEAGELESMKDTTHSIMSASLQLRQALQAARASELDAARHQLHAAEMQLEFSWWQQLVPTTVLHETDRRQMTVRLAALRLSTKSQWLLDRMASALLDPATASPVDDVSDGGKSTPLPRTVEANVALQLLHVRRLVLHATLQLRHATSDTKWQDLLALLDGGASMAPLEALLDAALAEWSQDGALSPGSEMQPGVGDRLVRCATDWMKALAPKLEVLAGGSTQRQVKLHVRGQVYQLALQCRALAESHELRHVVWQLHQRLAVDWGDDVDTDDADDPFVVASTPNSAVDQLNVLLAYAKSVTAIAPFLERVKALAKLVAKGALLDALAPATSSSSSSTHVPLVDLRADQIRSELAQAANLMLAVEETTETCHKLQARVKEMEKSDGHSRVLIAKHEQEIARLYGEADAHAGALHKVAEQLEQERRQCDQLLTEQHKEHAALEAANRTLRKQLRRTSDLQKKPNDAPVPVVVGGGATTTTDGVAKKALDELQRQLHVVRTELALARLPPTLHLVEQAKPMQDDALATCVQDVAALVARVRTRSALPQLVDLTKKNVVAPMMMETEMAKLLDECNRVRAHVSATLEREDAAWTKEVVAAVGAGEVWFTGRSCDPRPQDHGLPLRPMGRLIFPGRGGVSVPVVLNAAEMHLLSRAITLA
ncbi:Aste57867_25002 [Aphanomyces stellatus]|uniref:Aste57867_25002 protein n=1 Tax=Aphanomyces stellatus TaxID=120398 RepID=A0A485LS03_9STRA|nr:hypothetical protein As57867_024924 [Aphanomyces stellatus]VFU01633.1 Aste57867_25002 [Aphanomyces stellatus]